jgi:hypothetical protein
LLPETEIRKSDLKKFRDLTSPDKIDLQTPLQTKKKVATIITVEIRTNKTKDIFKDTQFVGITHVSQVTLYLS